MNASYKNYSAREAAAKLGLSKPTMYKYIKMGKIKCINVGDGTKKPRWSFTDEDLDKIKEEMGSFYGKTTVVKKKKRNKKSNEILDLLKENRKLRKEIEELRKEREKMFSELLNVMSKYE